MCMVFFVQCYLHYYLLAIIYPVNCLLFFLDYLVFGLSFRGLEKDCLRFHHRKLLLCCRLLPQDLSEKWNYVRGLNGNGKNVIIIIYFEKEIKME